jgi:hypothetical protein
MFEFAQAPVVTAAKSQHVMEIFSPAEFWIESEISRKVADLTPQTGEMFWYLIAQKTHSSTIWAE